MEVDARLTAMPAELLADYLKVRKAKRAGEFTKTAIDGMEREAAKAGLSLESAIRACCEFSWQGFNAGWYRDRTQGRQAPTSKHAAAARAIYGNGHQQETIDV